MSGKCVNGQPRCTFLSTAANWRACAKEPGRPRSTLLSILTLDYDGRCGFEFHHTLYIKCPPKRTRDVIVPRPVQQRV